MGKREKWEERAWRERIWSMVILILGRHYIARRWVYNTRGMGQKATTGILYIMKDDMFEYKCVDRAMYIQHF